MRQVSLWSSVVLAVAALSFAGCGKSEKSAKYRIAVIPKGTTHIFWESIHAGAIKAAREHGDAEILWEGPASEDQLDVQQQIVERFTTKGVSAIVVAPCNQETLAAPVERAIQRGIPVVIFDSGLQLPAETRQNDKYLGYIATNNREGGRQAGKRMIEVLKDKPNAKVMMIRYEAGHESTMQREEGFAEVVRPVFGQNFIIPAEDAGATSTSAQNAAEKLLVRHQDLDGIFAPNESSTIGVLRALQGSKDETGGVRAGQVKLVGFDSSDLLMEGIKNGQVHGLVLQDPFDMGYQSVKRALDYLEGKPLPQDRDKSTNLAVVTKDNLEDEKIKAMYALDLKPYLGK